MAAGGLSASRQDCVIQIWQAEFRKDLLDLESKIVIPVIKHQIRISVFHMAITEDKVMSFVVEECTIRPQDDAARAKPARHEASAGLEL